MGGYESMVASEILRGRYRTGFDRPKPIPAGRIEAYTVDLHQQSYRFLKGHRIMGPGAKQLVSRVRPESAEFRPQHLRGAAPGFSIRHAAGVSIDGTRFSNRAAGPRGVIDPYP